MLSVQDKVFRRIKRKGYRWVFTPKDFFDLGSQYAVNQALYRLCKGQKIKRYKHGIYYLPKISPIIGPVGVSISGLIDAIARRDDMKLQDSGDRCANGLGLSEQVPAKTVYLTDGRSKTIKIGNLVVRFKHASPRNMLGVGTPAGSVYQAFKYLRGHNIDDKIIRLAAQRLRPQDKRFLKKHRNLISASIRPAIDAVISAQVD